MGKYYFHEDNEENCYEIDYFERGDIVFEAKIERGVDVFYCAAYGESGEKGNCGNVCKKYIPRNGKSGICKFNRPVYEKTNKSIIV